VARDQVDNGAHGLDISVAVTERGDEPFLMKQVVRKLVTAGIDLPLVIDRRRRGDIVFTRRRAVAFVDGCFWHGCPEHYSPPARNGDFWRSKVERNRDRDRETDALLLEAGWLPVRAWEHEDPDEVAARVVDTVGSRVAS
jgi:DNA mismatch endonuclease Vsr